MGPFELFDPTNPTGAAIVLGMNGYIEKADLAGLVRPFLVRRLPQGLINHVVAHLSGTARRKPGRRRKITGPEIDTSTIAGAEAMFRRDGYLDGGIVAALIRPLLLGELTDAVVDHVVAHLNGTVRRKPGPGARYSKPLELMFAEFAYHEALAWFRLPPGERGPWAFDVDPDALPGDSPHEKAAEVVRANFERFKMTSAPRVLNWLSELNADRLKPPSGKLQALISLHAGETRERERRRLENLGPTNSP